MFRYALSTDETSWNEALDSQKSGSDILPVKTDAKRKTDNNGLWKDRTKTTHKKHKFHH